MSSTWCNDAVCVVLCVAACVAACVAVCCVAVRLTWRNDAVPVDRVDTMAAVQGDDDRDSLTDPPSSLGLPQTLSCIAVCVAVCVAVCDAVCVAV